jgi:hypothetical protein
MPRGLAQECPVAADARVSRELNGLRLVWDEAYGIGYFRGAAEPWHAWRLDNQQCLKARSAAELQAAMIIDHSIRPVRAADLSPTAEECPGTGALMPDGRPRWRA